MNEYIFKIAKIEQPAEDLLVVDLVRLNNEAVFDYRPGQFVLISFRNSRGVIEEKHTFSLASSPTDKTKLQLGIRIGGRFTRELLKLKPGAEIIVHGPYGSFGFDETKHSSAVFLAGGIGVTPFLSAIRYISDKKLPNQVSLICSNRTLAGTAFFTEINELSQKNKNIITLFSITDEPVNLPGVMNKQINQEALQSFSGELGDKTFFLCGPPSFMAAMKKYLLKLGVRQENILMEEFAMISNGTLLKNISYATELIIWSLLAMLLPFYLIYAAETRNIDKKPIEENQIIEQDVKNVLPTSPERNSSFQNNDSQQNPPQNIKVIPSQNNKTIQTPINQPAVSQPSVKTTASTSPIKANEVLTPAVTIEEKKEIEKDYGSEEREHDEDEDED